MVKLNDFLCERRLGSGAFGCVYLAKRKSDCELYVIKVQSDRDSSEIVQNEVSLLSKMRHPNVVAYHDFWREGRAFCILMEYATKGTLKDLLRRRAAPLDEGDALYIFSQIVLGVHHIHKQKVLHRDLKPGNIMLTGHRGDVVKIGDFGVSKRVTREPNMTIVGTRSYMAPEVLAGSSYGFECDIWSMGIVLHEMLSKQFPFTTTNHLIMLDEISEGKIKPLPIISKVSSIIARMLQENPRKRPRANQLVLCPLLLPHIARVYINLGRAEREMLLGKTKAS